jgi:hypothetical protein
MRRYFVTTMVLLGLLVATAGAHSLWVEAEDMADVGEPLTVYSFFGHVSSVAGFYVPLMDAHYLIAPDGNKQDLTMETGDWLPGFGWIGYSYADVTPDQAGDYVFAAVRSPGVYDPAWHGSSASEPRLSGNFAKAIIHVGDENAGSWDAGFPLEVTSEVAPYEIKAGDNVTFVAMYEDEPVSATYSAAYWTWDSGENVQTGTTGEDGDFTVNFSQSGPWLVSASYSIPGEDEWTATYDSADHYQVGDVVSYDYSSYKSTLTVWVK